MRIASHPAYCSGPRKIFKKTTLVNLLWIVCAFLAFGLMVVLSGSRPAHIIMLKRRMYLKIVQYTPAAEQVERAVLLTACSLTGVCGNGPSLRDSRKQWRLIIIIWFQDTHSLLFQRQVGCQFLFPFVNKQLTRRPWRHSEGMLEARLYAQEEITAESSRKWLK